MTHSAKEAVSIIKKRLSENFVPKVGIILGSGLGALAQQIEQDVIIPYEELPNFNVVHVYGEMEHFSISHVAGHGKKLHLGYVHGVPVACLEGRAHFYEGGNCTEVLKTMIRTLRLSGCEILLTTNAVGSLRPEVGSGNLMLVKDHINFMFSNPLIGKNDDEFGERFVSLDSAYDADLRHIMLEVARQHEITLHEGVFLATSGPTYESHAEIRMYQMLGADAVGMSTVPETIIARHCGLRVVTVGTITNLAAGLSTEILNHDNVLKNSALAANNLNKLFSEFVAKFK